MMSTAVSALIVPDQPSNHVGPEGHADRAGASNNQVSRVHSFTTCLSACQPAGRRSRCRA